MRFLQLYLARTRVPVQYVPQPGTGMGTGVMLVDLNYFSNKDFMHFKIGPLVSLLVPGTMPGTCTQQLRERRLH